MRAREGEPVFEEPIAQGPITRGFDYYFGVDTPNFTPHTFLENDRMVVAPTKRDKWGVSAPGWRADRMLPTIWRKPRRISPSAPGQKAVLPLPGADLAA